MLFVSYGSDIVNDTYNLLKNSDIHTYLKPGYKVSLKPNLVVAGPASNGAVTHPEIAEGVIKYLKEYGIGQIKIIESSSIGVSTQDAYKYCGYLELSKKYDIPLIDLKKDKTTTLSHSGLDIEIYSEALETDFLINLPVHKAHCQTRLTCCLKNLKGCIPDSEKRRFHTLGIHKPVAILNALVKTGYCVVDGICGDLSFEEGGTPVTSNRIIAGRDPVTVDSYCAKLIGYEYDDIEYLTYAHKLGIGKLYSKDDTAITQTGSDIQKTAADRKNKNTLIADKYRNIINDDSACSACYASLIYALHRMGGMPDKNTRFCIGQGYKGKTADEVAVRTGIGIGIGNKSCIGIGECAKGFETYVKGCPPSAADILDVLHNID